MNNYFNLKKSKLLLLTFLTLTMGTSPAWAQKALPYSYGFEDNKISSLSTKITHCSTKISGLSTITGSLSMKMNGLSTISNKKSR